MTSRAGRRRTTRDAGAAGVLFAAAFYLGYQAAKLANGIDPNLGMLDAAIVVSSATAACALGSGARPPAEADP